MPIPPITNVRLGSLDFISPGSRNVTALLSIEVWRDQGDVRGWRHRVYHPRSAAQIQRALLFLLRHQERALQRSRAAAQIHEVIAGGSEAFAEVAP